MKLTGEFEMRDMGRKYDDFTSAIAYVRENGICKKKEEVVFKI